MTYSLIVFLLFGFVESRGRYEFIEEADLPAFYTMRSAQLAQKAQMAPQQILPDYSPYYPYPYQTVVATEPQPFSYSPLPLYGPTINRPAPTPFPTARPAPVQYPPMAYFHGNPAGIVPPNASPTSQIRKKTA
ncbi:unnamed protein product [Caenorhabditis bovis]|uniref:Uncharacterized protein n=1 Tax=Caenorhabditis bovis TaxID=2654633 RepID=A0A8S1E762_9PELO|nr:unnamed protein product [Caenorhabditis bovis]